MEQESEKNAKIFTYLSDFSKLKYESEIRREDSLIQQASHMQTAFSFLTAALFMIAPLTIEYRGDLSLAFFLVAFSSITLLLLLSLLFATMAQNRKKNATFPDIALMRDYVINNESLFVTEAQRQKYLTDTYADVQKSKAEINDKRVKWIRLSMLLFYIALALCAFWFVVGICKIL